MGTSRLEIIRQCDPANTPIRPATHGMSVGCGCCLRRHTGTIAVLPRTQNMVCVCGRTLAARCRRIIVCRAIKAFSRKQPKNACRNCKNRRFGTQRMVDQARVSKNIFSSFPKTLLTNICLDVIIRHKEKGKENPKHQGEKT